MTANSVIAGAESFRATAADKTVVDIKTSLSESMKLFEASGKRIDI